MSEESRGNLTLGLWFLSAISLIALFISAAAQGELTTGHIVLAFTILTTAIIASPLLLRWKESEDSAAQPEKAKQRRIDKLLNDMSDEELAELKQRLVDDDFNADAVAHSLGDDGELVRRR